jgi:16S rRNA C1402 (ribose-2'-O) methylase RsmI
MRRILPDRKLTLALDMTKDDERVHQGDARALLQQVRSFSKDSEVTLVLSGARKGWK